MQFIDGAERKVNVLYVLYVYVNGVNASPKIANKSPQIANESPKTPERY